MTRRLLGTPAMSDSAGGISGARRFLVDGGSAAELAWAARTFMGHGLAAEGAEAALRSIEAGRHDANLALVAVDHAPGDEAGGRIVAALAATLRATGPDLDPAGRIRLALALIDRIDPDRDPAEAMRAALRELADALPGSPNPSTGFPGDRAARIAGWLRRAEPDPDLLESIALLPGDDELHTAAVSILTEAGITAPDRAAARDAERVLHAIGRKEDAYAIEQAWRGRRAVVRPAHEPHAPARSTLPAIVALAGGYPALRAAIRFDLVRAGVREVREIPSRFEGSRTTSQVRATLTSCQVAVLIVRQVDHSTSDAVRTAAAAVGIPVVMAERTSITSVRRALLRIGGGQGGD